jgi:hypothetical protein
VPWRFWEDFKNFSENKRTFRIQIYASLGLWKGSVKFVLFMPILETSIPGMDRAISVDKCHFYIECEIQPPIFLKGYLVNCLEHFCLLFFCLQIMFPQLFALFNTFTTSIFLVFHQFSKVASED